MKAKTVDRLSWIAVIATLLFIASPLIQSGVSRALEPSPYSNVVLHMAEVEDGELDVIASFMKNGACELLDDGRGFRPVGISDAVSQYLNFSDLDGLGQEFDREEGAQTLRITVYLAGGLWHTVELRTRHECRGSDDETRIVNRVFAKIPIDDVEAK